MNNNHSPLSNSTTTSHQITELMNTDILILNLTNVHQCINGTDEMHDFLMISDKC